MLKKLIAVSLLAAAVAAAQDKPAPSLHSVYRIEYSITETEGAKKINTRTYVLLVEDRKVGRTRIGNRVPLASKDGSIQYFDVGTNIDARPSMLDTGLVNLNTSVDISSVVTTEATTARAPITRNFQNNIETVIPLDKPTVIAIQDEPSGNSTFQVTVLVKLVK